MSARFSESAASSESPFEIGMVRGSAALNGDETFAGNETAGCLSDKADRAARPEVPTPALASYTP